MKIFSRNGNLLTEGQYNKDGKKSGVWKEYYNSGNILAIELFEDGKLHGNYKAFHENGCVWCIGNFNHGKKNGRFEIYNQQGKLILIQYYNDNVLIKQEDVS